MTRLDFAPKHQDFKSMSGMKLLVKSAFLQQHVFVGLSRTLANLGMTFYVYQGMPIRRQYMQ